MYGISMSATELMRYKVPGWGFIVSFIMTIADAIWGVVETNLNMGIFLSLLAYIGGEPLGFAISQLYYAIFELCGGYKTGGCFRCERKPVALIKKVIDTSPSLLKKYVHISNSVTQIDYFYVYQFLLHSFCIEKIVDFSRRRWDVIHGIRSLYLAIFLGTISGVVTRAYLLRLDIIMELFGIILALCLAFYLLAFTYITKIIKEIDTIESLCIQYLLFKLEKENEDEKKK